ncbi:MAG: hypothetical protein JXB45_08925 [Candidatus Krumholzibacteriota bacterium]|nr:hypothetical protein [Candidatus Krumholzibacteriota bacterium]
MITAARKKSAGSGMTGWGAFIFCFLLTGVSARGEEANWLNIALPGRPMTFMPVEVDDAVSTTVLQNNVFEGLVRYDESRHVIEPALAVDWELDGTGLVWTFNLREGVRFHDGSPLTAGEVVDCYRGNPKFEGQIEKTGPLQVRCVLPRVLVGFLKTISNVKYAVAKTLPGGGVVGTGPFFLDQWNPAEKIVLKSFGDYWRGKSTLEGVNFRCLVNAREALKQMREGSIDVFAVVPPSLAGEIQADKNIVLSVLKGANTCFIYINTSRPPLDKTEFRQALNLGINRENIIRDVYLKQAMECAGILPPVIGGRSGGPGRVGYDPAAAREIVKKYLNGKKHVFKLIGLPYMRPYCPEPNHMARLIAGYLKGIGLKIEYVQTKSMADFMERIGGDDYDFIVDGWIISSGNPDDFYTGLFGIGEADCLYGSCWKNEQFESLILHARETVPEENQMELYERADRIIFQEYPWIILVHSNQLGAYRKGVSGLVFSPTGELRLHAVGKNI